MSLRFFSVALVLGAALTLSARPSTARAQSDSTEGDAVVDARDDLARVLYEEGTEAHNRGDYEVALAKFEEAYAQSQRPGLLFNIGVAAERLRHDERALQAYRQYIRELPDAPNRRAVEQRIAIIERAPSVAPDDVAAAASDDIGSTGRAVEDDDQSVEEDEPAVYEQWWFWVLSAAIVGGGIAAALVLTGGTEDPTNGDLMQGTSSQVTTLRWAL